MRLKILLIVGSFLMANFVDAEASASEPKKNDPVRIEVLTGVQAEVVRIAVERFREEKLNISPYGYDVEVYIDNDDYNVFFVRAKNAAPNTINPGYEVVISSKTLKITHTQFSR